MKRLRAGVIGAGHLGRFHARLLAARTDVELVGVVDPLEASRQSVAEEFDTAAVADYRELLGKVDAVVVATPTTTHLSVASAFLENGVATLVEKPLATDAKQAATLVALAKQQGVVLQVGHVEQFNPALRAVLPYVDDPQYIEAARFGALTFRSTDIGAVMDLMIHDLDIALTLADSPVASIQAVGRSLTGRHEDVAQARLEFESGCVANLSASRLGNATTREMRVWAAGAFCRVDYGRCEAEVTEPSETLLRGELELAALSSRERNHLKQDFNERHLPTRQLEVESTNPIADEQEDFFTSIRQSSRPRVDGERGYQAVAVAEQIVAAIRQHQSGKRGLAELPTTVLPGPHPSDSDRSFVPPRRRAG